MFGEQLEGYYQDLRVKFRKSAYKIFLRIYNVRYKLVGKVENEE